MLVYVCAVHTLIPGKSGEYIPDSEDLEPQIPRSGLQILGFRVNYPKISTFRVFM